MKQIAAMARVFGIEVQFQILRRIPSAEIEPAVPPDATLNPLKPTSAPAKQSPPWRRHLPGAELIAKVHPIPAPISEKWRRGELNPCPDDLHHKLLHV
jgi:hypothetical protein